jgi:PAS domain S-box-containing protein
VVEGEAEDPLLGWLAAVLDLIPTPLALVEPDTARLTFANRAADRLAGGELPRDVAPEDYALRAARGERLENLELDCHTDGGVRSLLVSSNVVPAVFGQPEAIVVSFEDVTALKRAEKARAAQAGAYEQLHEDAEAAQGRSVEALALLDTLFDTAPVGLAYFDRELRFVRINDALAEINGVPAPEHLGRTVPDVLPEMDPEVVTSFRRVIETGEAIVDMPVVGATPASPGEVRHWSGSWYPVRGADGEVLGLGAVVLETTERQRADEERERAHAAERAARERAERAERRARFLAEATATISESLDYEDTLRRVVSLAVPDRARWCAIDMLAADGSIERVAIAHSDPAKERRGRELSHRWPAAVQDPDGLARVLGTGLAVLLSEVTDRTLAGAATDGGQLRILRELGLRSVMIVPLRSRRRVLGALTFVSDAHGLRYNEDDLGVAQELAARAGAAVENARLYRSRALPLLVRAEGEVEAVGEPGTLLGVLPDVEHIDTGARLRPGDAIVLFTDGLTEAGAPDRVMSAEALVELVGSCAGLGADEIARRVEEHAVSLQGGAARDDLALVVARVPA